MTQIGDDRRKISDDRRPNDGKCRAAVAVAESRRDYGGIGRLEYAACCTLALAFCFWFENLPGLLRLWPHLLLIAATAYRYKNMGLKPRWAILVIVPICDMFVVLRCLANPEGFRATRRLDPAGIVVGVILVPILGVLLLVRLPLLIDLVESAVG